MVTTLNDRVLNLYNQNQCGKLVLEELSRTKVFVEKMKKVKVSKQETGL